MMDSTGRATIKVQFDLSPLIEQLNSFAAFAATLADHLNDEGVPEPLKVDVPEYDYPEKGDGR